MLGQRLNSVCPATSPARVGWMIGGVIHGQCVGWHWRDCPPDHVPSTTIDDRFKRWSQRGLGTRIFATLSAEAQLPSELSIHTTAVRAHQSVQGGRRGENSGRRALPWRSGHDNPRPDRSLRAVRGVHPRPRELRRHPGRARLASSFFTANLIGETFLRPGRGRWWSCRHARICSWVSASFESSVSLRNPSRSRLLKRST